MSSNIELFNMDCMEAMKEMPDKAFDLAIVDPPYRDENQPTQNMRAAGEMRLFSRPSREYWAELFRVSKEHIIWGANNFSLPQFKGFVVWEKGIPENFTMSMVELAAISEGIGTVAKIVRINVQGQVRIHPTQKPVKLYKWLLKNYAKDGDKILDTHLGSGSIAIACYDMGFDFTGYEIDKEYFDAAVKRLENHKKQLTFI